MMAAAGFADIAIQKATDKHRTFACILGNR
jgi:hypothetical protein